MQTYSYEIPHDVTSRLYGDWITFWPSTYVQQVFEVVFLPEQMRATELATIQGCRMELTASKEFLHSLCRYELQSH